MRQISVSEFSTYRWSFEEDLLRYQALGCNSIGVWRRKIEDYGQQDAIDLVHESKMDVSSVHWAGGFTGSDGRSYVEGVDDAVEAIELASQLNAGCLILHPGGRNGHTNSHAMRLIESALTTLVPVAQDYGVKLALEFIPGFTQSPWTFIHSFKQTWQLLEMFPAEHLGLVLDLYHVGFNEPTMQRMDELIDRIALVQLSDRENIGLDEEFRLPLGEGSVNLTAWLDQLDSLGYQGPLELELHGLGTEGIDYFELLDSSLDFVQNELPVRVTPVKEKTNALPARQPQQINTGE
jgi:sugar phosphate isomerase/epimerase